MRNAELRLKKINSTVLSLVFDSKKFPIYVIYFMYHIQQDCNALL